MRPAPAFKDTGFIPKVSALIELGMKCHFCFVRGGDYQTVVSKLSFKSWISEHEESLELR